MTIPQDLIAHARMYERAASVVAKVESKVNNDLLFNGFDFDNGTELFVTFTTWDGCCGSIRFDPERTAHAEIAMDYSEDFDSDSSDEDIAQAILRHLYDA